MQHLEAWGVQSRGRPWQATGADDGAAQTDGGERETTGTRSQAAAIGEAALHHRTAGTIHRSPLKGGPATGPSGPYGTGRGTANAQEARADSNEREKGGERKRETRNSNFIANCLEAKEGKGKLR